MLAKESYEEYAIRPGLRSSDMKRLYRTPSEFWLSRQEGYQPKPQSKAMGLGEYVHALLLEPDRLEKFAVNPGLDGRTAEGKKWAAENADKNIISLADAELAKRLAWKCQNHPRAGKLVSAQADKEVSLEGSCNGRPAKIRLDCHLPGTDSMNGIIGDIKTTRHDRVEDFLHDCAVYDYDLQAEFYKQVYKSVFGDLPHWFWIAISTSCDELWVINLYDLNDFLRSGRAKLAIAIKNLEQIELLGASAISDDRAVLSQRTRWLLDSVFNHKIEAGVVE